MTNPHYTESLRRLMEAFGSLPGVGARTAERYAFHILKGSRENAMKLADTIRAVKDQVRHCSICFNLTEDDPCEICKDDSRDHSVICVVEQPKDLLQLESASVYKGVYHVLLGRIAPLDRMEPTELAIPQLLARLDDSVKEVILATNPTMEGDGTALYLQQEILKVAPHLTITRLARGLPAGAQIEYSNKAILADAITGRTKA